MARNVNDLPPYLDYGDFDDTWSNRPLYIHDLRDRHPEFQAAIEQIRAAGSWAGISREKKPQPSTEEWERIGRGETTCPICKDSKSDHRTMTIISTGYHIRTLYQCKCIMARRYFRLYDQLCPPIFKGKIFFPTLAPSAKSKMPVDKQAHYIDELKANPRCSYLMCGPGGWGKTAFSIALLQVACNDFVAYSQRGGMAAKGVFRITASQMIDEWAAYKRGADENGNRPPWPSVSEDRLRQVAANGFKPRLFLEEIDKLVLNDKREDYLFSIFNAIYETGGQIVMTSNLTPDQIATRFRPENKVAFMRRIKGDDDDGRIWNFWTLFPKVKQ